MKTLIGGFRDCAVPRCTNRGTEVVRWSDGDSDMLCVGHAAFAHTVVGTLEVVCA